MYEAIITSGEGEEKTFEIRDTTDPFKPERHGAPWIAKIVLDGGKLAYKFGNWIGDKKKGSKGILILKAVHPGDFVAFGQKHLKYEKSSIHVIYKVCDDGTMDCSDRQEAYMGLSEKKRS